MLLSLSHIILISTSGIQLIAIVCAGVLLCGHNLQYDHKARFGDPKKQGTKASKVSPSCYTRANPARFLHTYVFVLSAIDETTHMLSSTHTLVTDIRCQLCSTTGSI
jgi:hypothetical protein